MILFNDDTEVSDAQKSNDKTLVAQIEHLKQANETLRNMTKQYTTKYKERELELTKEFNKKQEKYQSQIDQLQQDNTQYQQQLNSFTKQAQRRRATDAEHASSQYGELQKEIQSLKHELNSKDTIIQQLKTELNDETKINNQLQQVLHSNTGEIDVLKKKISTMAKMDQHHHVKWNSRISSTIMIKPPNVDLYDANDMNRTITATSRKRGSSTHTNNDGRISGTKTHDVSQGPIFADVWTNGTDTITSKFSGLGKLMIPGGFPGTSALSAATTGHETPTNVITIGKIGTRRARSTGSPDSPHEDTPNASLPGFKPSQVTCALPSIHIFLVHIAIFF